MTATIAYSEQEYVEIVLRLATDRLFYTDVKEKFWLASHSPRW